MESATYDALISLHEEPSVWSEGLREGELFKIYKYTLSPMERAITDLRIGGMVDGEVAINLNVKISTVKKYVWEIKYKFRNGLGSRISNHPALRKSKGFIVRRTRRNK